LALKATQTFVLLYIFINQNKRLIKPIVIKNIIAILFFCTCMCDVSGQAFPKFAFTRSNCANELPIEICSYISKDSEGFLWISTFDGLCRYDGKNLTVFKNDPGNNNSIANNHIGYTSEDKEGNIWIAHRKGISCFIKKEGKFKNYKVYVNLKGDTANIPYNPIVMDYLGNIYSPDIAGYENKIFDKKANIFKSFYIDTTNDGHNKKGVSNKLVGVLSHTQQDGSMYLQSINGTFLFDPKTKKRTRVCDSSNYTPLYIFKDHKKRLWLAEWDGGISIIDEKTKLKQNIIPKNRIVSLVEYKDLHGKYWILASDMQTSSIFIIDPETKAYTNQLFKIENELTAAITANGMLVDEKGRVYVSSVLGLAEAIPSKQYISNVFTYERGKPVDVFYDNLVRSGMQKENGNYVVGLLGYNGLREYDSNLVLKKAIKNYNHNGKNYDLDVRNFLSIGDNKFIISGLTGIALLENEKITPIKYVSKKDILTDTLLPHVREMLPIGNNNYWVRIINHGVSIFNTSTNSFIKQYYHADKAKTIPLNNIRNISYDNKNRLWLLDLDALYLYDNATDEFVKQPINESKKYLTSLYNMSIVKDNVWITGAGGLLQYNVVTKKEFFYSTKNGLPNEEIFKVVLYNNETACILHERGLSILNTKTRQVNNYNQKNGLPAASIEYDGCFFLDNNNHLLMGNTGILTKIDIANLLKTNGGAPSLAITTVQGSDSTIQITLNDKNEKHAYLDFKNFPVNINFSIVDFSTNSERKYFYRYTGKDTTWIPCANGVVAINTIKPGDYTLQVMGSVNGMYADKLEQITFTILPRWHQTWWFKLLAGILLFTGISSLYRWRINTAKASQKQETEIQRLAAQEYKNQLELSQISNYFSTSLINLETEEEVLWDVAKNLIGKLGFEDCIIYLWNKDKTKLVQRAGYGPKGSIEEINKQPFDVVLGQGVVGYVAQTKEPVLINDTRNDERYRIDELSRLSEICVPILHENELVGVIDSEHTNANFYTKNNLQSLINIAAYLGNKLADIKNKQAIQRNSEELQKTLDLLKGAQLEALRSQMNPHFIFNCLNSIKLYTTQNDTVAASNYLTKFSKLIRLALENSKSETIPLSTELEALELYIEMEAMRFKEKLKYSIIINENVDADFIEIPPLLLQPYVENSIWHGLMHKEEGGRIDIHIGIVPQKYILEITIKDDGVGREKAAFLKSKSATSHKSFGTKVTSDRLEIVNQLYKTGASVHTEDVITNNEVTGTLVTLRVPFE
jgi:LytS/YehU family sensor histidine kinase/ligand-binding sensor domain-containing protein